MATVTTFTIIKGKALDFTIQVKENGTTLPLVLDVGDTFTFSLLNRKTGELYVDSKAMSIEDAPNGIVAGTITDVESGTLPLKVSAAEDRYMSRPNLRVAIYGTTLAQGDMTAFIDDVYVVVG